MRFSTRLPASRPAAAALLLALAAAPGCGLVDKLLGGADKAVAEGQQKLSAGDLPGAADVFAAAAKDHPDSVDAAAGAAFTALLQGDAAAADGYLAAAEAKAGDRLGEVKMRRALVALESGDLDKVKAFGEASGLPAGQLLAAEVALADGERDEAHGLLEKARGGQGAVGRTAKRYLELLDDPEPVVAGLAESAALWALGEKEVAVRSVEDLLTNLPDDFENRDAEVLLWAGRAASVHETDVARSLLDAVIFPPEGQAWRKVATRAMVACADGDGGTCLSLFDNLEGNAPEDGLADARATAAVLIAKDDPEAARKLVGPYISNAAARALVEAGDRDSARDAVPGGVYASYLKNGG